MSHRIALIRRLAVAGLIACAALSAALASTASAAVPGVAQAWHYEVHFVNNTGHTLQLVSASDGGGGESWDTKPPASVTPGETGTFEVGSTELSAGGVVVYQDAQTGAQVTFSGHADSLIDDSWTYAKATGGMQISGHQGYYGGITPHINVTYTLSY